MALFIWSEFEQTRDDLSATAPAGFPDDSHPIGLYGALAAVKTTCDFFRAAAASGVLQHLDLANAQRVPPTELDYQAHHPSLRIYRAHRLLPTALRSSRAPQPALTMGTIPRPTRVGLHAVA